jgi:hypothetical protein
VGISNEEFIYGESGLFELVTQITSDEGLILMRDKLEEGDQYGEGGKRFFL